MSEGRFALIHAKRFRGVDANGATGWAGESEDADENHDHGGSRNDAGDALPATTGDIKIPHATAVKRRGRLITGKQISFDRAELSRKLELISRLIVRKKYASDSEWARP